jgi:hypothetical protein
LGAATFVAFIFSVTICGASMFGATAYGTAESGAAQSPLFRASEPSNAPTIEAIVFGGGRRGSLSRVARTLVLVPLCLVLALRIGVVAFDRGGRGGTSVPGICGRIVKPGGNRGGLSGSAGTGCRVTGA